MGSSNFIVVDPGFVNADSDATYAAESITVSGVAPGGIIPHGFLNKFMAQNSSGVAALMQALANQGFVVSDSNYAALVTTLQNGLLTSAGVRTNPIIIPYSPNPVFNAAPNTKFEMFLTSGQNVTSSSLTGVQFGDVLIFNIEIEGFGGTTPTFAWSGGPNAVVGGGVPQKLNSSGATTANVQSFFVDVHSVAVSMGPMASFVI